MHNRIRGYIIMYRETYNIMKYGNNLRLFRRDDTAYCAENIIRTTIYYIIIYVQWRMKFFTHIYDSVRGYLHN